MTLGEKIKTIREAMRYSQFELASDLNRAQSLISAYERDLRKPSYDVLVFLDKMAKKYKVKVKLI